MLAAVRKKLMLGVIIDACLQRQIEQRKARPECNPARAAHLYMAGAAQIERGGVVSSLGKGIAAASLGAILESRGLAVTLLKLDPYINVDPGTMNPLQHGE